jgi:coniferyl-aldehyde dehydrogenase
MAARISVGGDGYALLAKRLHLPTSRWRSVRLDFGPMQRLPIEGNMEFQVTTTAFKTNLHGLIQLQRTAYTKEGVPEAATRKDRLTRAATMLARASDAVTVAVSEDFGHRSAEETRFEIFGAVNAFRNAAMKIENWMQPAQHPALAPDAEARVEYVPRGVIGLIGPWNYPIMCVFGPLAGILAAGNRAIIKPSELTPRTSALLALLIAETFHPSEIALVHGEASEGAVFSAAPFDHLMFTGSTSVGRHVMRAAADNLTPVTLELGGKSPVIVCDTYDLAEAAQRVMAVKLRSAGQICLAPDYALVPAGKEREFAEQCVGAARRLYPDGLDSVDYTSIINDAHFGRLKWLVTDADARGAEVLSVFKPGGLASARRMMPALILNPPRDALVMPDEIFGPILPILGYRSIDDALETIRSGPPPLALYYFGADDERARQVLDGTASGGVTINDVMTHMFVEDMPFGGIGASGMGAYRGETGFRTFSHARAIYRQTEEKQAVALLHPPFGGLFRKFLSAAIAG